MSLRKRVLNFCNDTLFWNEIYEITKCRRNQNVYKQHFAFLINWLISQAKWKNRIWYSESHSYFTLLYWFSLLEKKQHIYLHQIQNMFLTLTVAALTVVKSLRTLHSTKLSTTKVKFEPLTHSFDTHCTISTKFLRIMYK